MASRLRNNIREIRSARGMSLEDVASLADTSPQQVSRLERGERRLTLEWIERLSDAMVCDPGELITNVLPHGLKVVYAPLVSWVAAGRLHDPADPYEPGDSEKLVAVDYVRATVIALRVEGDSMNRVAPQGSVVIVDYEERELVSGRYYVIKMNGDVTFKQYRAEPARFEPASTEPHHETIFPQGPVEVVGRVVRVTNEL